jgi:hypothetical protein
MGDQLSAAGGLLKSFPPPMVGAASGCLGVLEYDVKTVFILKKLFIHPIEFEFSWLRPEDPTIV